MKKVVLLLLTLILSLAIMGCGTSTTTGTSETTSNGTTPAEASAETQADSGIMADSGTLGDYTVTIKSARLTTNYKDEPSIIITYDFTNNSDKTASFAFSTSSKVFQNGIECDTTISSYNDDTFSSENSLKDIKTGATLEVEAIYKLNDETSDVEVEVSKLIDFSKNPATIVKIFTIG